MRVSLPALQVHPQFVDVAQASGIDFTFFNDEVKDRFFLPEVMGGGAAWLDFDRDGWLDLYLVNGAPLADADPRQRTYLNRLFRQGGGSFQDITIPAAATQGGFGQGVCVGDFDADGFPDLYIANFGPNALLRNNGDGTFQDVTEVSGVGDTLWGTSSVWLDLDGDQMLDLYVTNYLDVTLASSQVCNYNGLPGYCGPGNYPAAPDRVYRSNGDGTFTEAAESLGLVTASGKGLAIAVADFDSDATPEIYVANDMEENQLYRRQPPEASAVGEVRYRDEAQAAGCAVSGEGNAEASMGVCCADFDGDGLVDIFLTHYYSHKNTLYRNLGGLLFEDDSRRTRIAATSYETLGFGTVAFDFDRDGWQDLFVANGHVLGPLQKPNEMRPQLLRNDRTGKFDDVSDLAGPYFQDLWLGRGAAGADFDEDGDTDLLVTHLHRPVVLLRNDTRSPHPFLGLELLTPTRVPPWGARVVVKTGARELVLPVVGGGSYLCSGDPRLLVGLGTAGATVAVEVYWPSGRKDSYAELAVDRYWRVMEGSLPEPLHRARETYEN